MGFSKEKKKESKKRKREVQNASTVHQQTQGTNSLRVIEPFIAEKHFMEKEKKSELRLTLVFFSNDKLKCKPNEMSEKLTK